MKPFKTCSTTYAEYLRKFSSKFSSAQVFWQVLLSCVDVIKSYHFSSSVSNILNSLILFYSMLKNCCILACKNVQLKFLTIVHLIILL